MPRKKTGASVEIVPLSPREIDSQTHRELKNMIARMVDEQVKEAMSGPAADLQPFFGSKEVSYEIKRRQTVHEQNKFSYFFEDWGCMICGSRKAAYGGAGMCDTCYVRVKGRIASSLRKHRPKDSIQPTFTDSLRLAREALAPAKNTTDDLERRRAGPIDPKCHSPKE